MSGENPETTELAGDTAAGEGDGNPVDTGDDGSGVADGGAGGEPPPHGVTGEAAPDPPPVPDPEEDWRAALRAAAELTPATVAAITDAHGDRGARAVEAVGEGRVKQYRDFTVVVGHEDEYVVEDGGCTCADARYNLDPDDDDQRCWHALAVDVAEAVGAVDHHDMWYSEVRDFI